jgi:tetratricopeptide (TPR) repeat protein
MEPRNGFAYSNRSFCKLKLGDLEGAMDDANKAIKFNPGNSWAFKNRGLIYIEMGKGQEACEDFNRAVNLGYTTMYDKEVSELIKKYCR